MAPNYAEGRKKMELRNAAVAANAAELPFLEPKQSRLNEVVGELGNLTTEQASLAAKKQEWGRFVAMVDGFVGPRP